MSPVSRGRKPKKKAKKAPAAQPRLGAQPGPSGLVDLQRLTAPAPRERPDWFDASIKTVLEQAGDVLAAGGPTELEQLTGELLGGEQHQVIHGRGRGLWFEWWFEELVTEVGRRITEQPTGAARAYWWLLHGLIAVGGRELRPIAQAERDQLRGELRGEIEALAAPAWLELAGACAATGEAWQLRDAYGSRIALIAGYTLPGGPDSAFLFDVDGCGVVRLVDAGAFGDLSQAAAAWRARVGEAAADARPSPVRGQDDLLPLVYCDLHRPMVYGDEQRTLMDNWFRAQRRAHDLAEALRVRRTPLPEAVSLYGGVDPDPMVTDFSDWHERRHGSKPDPEAAAVLAEEWMDGALPDTWHAASPHRAAFQLALMSDWEQDEITFGARALLPDWVRWHGEIAGTPPPLVDRAVAVAAGGPRLPTECAGQLT
jgi:hypothetical protein